MTVTDERNEAALQQQERADAYAADLRRLADMVSDRPSLHGDLWNMRDRVNIPIPGDVDAHEYLQQWTRLALDAGCKVKKSFDEWAGIHVHFPNGEITLFIYAERSRVCERVVKGTREVTKEVPDPEVLKAVPKVTVTETVEDFEWVCKPLLADTAGAA